MRRALSDSRKKHWQNIGQGKLFRRNTVAQLLACGLPTILCTIYNSGYAFGTGEAGRAYGEAIRVGLMLFNDVILRVAREHRFATIELRQICTDADEYANPIESSTVGAAKIAQAIVGTILTTVAR